MIVVRVYYDEEGCICGREVTTKSNLPDPENSLEIGFDDSIVGKYVKNGQLADRPAMPCLLDGLVLKGAPAGAVLTIDGADYQLDGSDVELEFAYPGRYSVKVVCWPYLDYEVIIEN